MSYIPFSDAWRKEYMKHTKAHILSRLKFKVDPDLPKARLIEFLRVELIVEQFNKNYKVGDKVRWRSVKDDSFPYHEYTTLTVAYIAQNGLPCVHFREKSGYCCVEPEFIESVNVEPGTSEEEKYEAAMSEIQAELDKLVDNEFNPKFPKFWYESKSVFGWVESMDELVEMAQKQISAQWGIYTIDDFLDKSKRSVDSDTDFGTRREHTTDYTLRKLLEENNLLFEFILLYRFVTEQNDA